MKFSLKITGQNILELSEGLFVIWHTTMFIMLSGGNPYGLLAGLPSHRCTNSVTQLASKHKSMSTTATCVIAKTHTYNLRKLHLVFGAKDGTQELIHKNINQLSETYFI